MSCDGRCFDIAPLEHIGPPDVKPVPCNSCINIGPLERAQSHDEQILPCQSHLTPDDELSIYSPLHHWQTRVLLLHPATYHNDQLETDMLVVDIHTTEGVKVEGTDEIIHYQALSYSWGHPDLDDVLLCNGKVKRISHDNTIALKALRHETKPVYLWIDAICINQKDKAEKSEQVAGMLDVYRKAQSVIAWLGELNNDGALAFACINQLSEMEDQLSRLKQVAHAPSCYDRIQAIYNALLALYSRKWLKRTWVRQEIFGARQLMVQCGSHKGFWEDYIQAASLLDVIGRLSPGKPTGISRAASRVKSLVTEAQTNARVPHSGMKQPRDLIEVLLSSQDFGVEDPRDTVYAVLGMCHVATLNKLDVGRSPLSHHPFAVDYRKSLAEVYTDVSLYIIGAPKARRRKMLADVWHSYRRSSLHSEDLPSWAIDWRYLRDANFRAVSEYVVKSYSMSTSHPGPRPTWTVYHADDWFPLRESPQRWPTQRDGSTVEPEDDWQWPRPDPANRSVLCVGARFLNYIAKLTDLTCDLDYFLRHASDESLGINLGSAALSIHASSRPRQGSYLFTHRASLFSTFDPEKHSWRLAILGVANDAQLCLVPPDARKGDMIIAIASETLPMLVRPVGTHDSTLGLLKTDDPYEDTAPPESHIHPRSQRDAVRDRRHYLALSILIDLVAFGIPLVKFSAKSFALAVAMLTSFGVVLALILVAFVWHVHRYWHEAQDPDTEIRISHSYVFWTFVEIVCFFLWTFETVIFLDPDHSSALAYGRRCVHTKINTWLGI